MVYGGVFIAACSIYPAFPGVISWLSNNLAGSYKRSAGMAVQIGVGNLGGVRYSRLNMMYELMRAKMLTVRRPWHPTFTAKRMAHDIS